MIDLRCGDCLAVMKTFPDNSVDAIVTDPPYGLSDHKTEDVIACLTAWLAGEPYVNGSRGFMGKTWDSWVPGPEVWRECYRVLKPGGYLLCFAGTRTDDLMSLAIRLAGFRKHPFLAWVFASGFPKATNLSKMIDKQAGAEREVVGIKIFPDGKSRINNNTYDGWGMKPDKGDPITAPATDLARQWDGWFYGLQSLKPAVEPVLMFQKSPDRGMVENVAAWGCGAINVDATRIPTDAPIAAHHGTNGANGHTMGKRNEYVPGTAGTVFQTQGRWPANLVHDGSAEVVGMFPNARSAGAYNGKPTNPRQSSNYLPGQTGAGWGYADTGSASRFFQACPPDDEDVQAQEEVQAVKGRWPANLVHDGSAEVVGLFPVTPSNGRNGDSGSGKSSGLFGIGSTRQETYFDEGSASRFFQACPPDDEDSLCALCELPKDARRGIITVKENIPCQSNASSAGASLSQSDTRSISGSVAIPAPASGKPNNGDRPEQSKRSVQPAVSDSAPLPVIAADTAPMNAESERLEKIVRNAKSAGNLCDLCATAIAQSIVALQQGQSPESHLGLAFTSERKRQILTQCLVSFVALLGSTDTIPTTESLSLLFGSALHAIANCTPNPIEQTVNETCQTRLRYVSKASRKDREEGCDGLPVVVAGAMHGNQTEEPSRLAGDHITPVQQVKAANFHPTVKPTPLMRWLVRLVTPPGGIVLDPFAGSGSTGKAAVLEGFSFIGIEQDAEYFEIARRRIAHAQEQLTLTLDTSQVLAPNTVHES